MKRHISKNSNMYMPIPDNDDTLMHFYTGMALSGFIAKYGNGKDFEKVKQECLRLGKRMIEK